MFTNEGYITKQGAIMLLKIRGITKLKHGENIDMAIRRSGNMRPTKVERIVLEFFNN